MGDVDFLFDGIDAIERLARLRELCALVALYAGWEHPAKEADVKQMGARSAGNPHAACDVEGAGNVARSGCLGRLARQSSTLPGKAPSTSKR